MTNELNIKSSTIEKGLDLIKDFTQKLIGPSIEEVGLLMSDTIRYFRFKNQVDILVKAQEYVKNKKIDVKEIPTKILVPLLENASLEEDEKMQDKWAFMIGNLADSEQNLQNQIFPYLLNQISLDEYNHLLKFRRKEEEFIKQSNELSEMKGKKNSLFSIEKRELYRKVTQARQEGFYIAGVEDYEYSNLQRLGLLKLMPPKIIINELQIEHNGYEESKFYPIDAEYETDDDGYRLTPLGFEFLSACEEK
tara:strand:- start:152 stop:901 length:750 start_codon:yes stop_codon:yes gene_type:complete